MASASVLVIASPGLHRTAHDQLGPYTLLLGAAAGWAVSIVFVRAHRFQASALALAPWQTLVAALLLLPFAISVDGALPPMNGRGVASLAYVGPIATAFAYWAVVEVGRYVRATTMSVALLAVPSLGLLISALTFHEAVNSGTQPEIIRPAHKLLVSAMTPIAVAKATTGYRLPNNSARSNLTAMMPARASVNPTTPAGLSSLIE